MELEIKVLDIDKEKLIQKLGTIVAIFKEEVSQ